jgi:hypothetical protein
MILSFICICVVGKPQVKKIAANLLSCSLPPR